MLNLSILNMATKLSKLYSGNSDTVAMHTRSFRMGVVTGLLLIAGLLPMLATAQTPTGVTLSLDPAEVTESAEATTITVTVTLIGGTFALERIALFRSEVSGSTATLTTDYTAVPITHLPIPANMASATTTIMFTAPMDTDDEPDGETVVFGAGIFNIGGTIIIDPSITAGAATLTINDYVPVTASAGADQLVVAGATVMLNGTVTSAAEATVATTWALTSSTATTAALVAAGVSAEDAATEVTRLTTALATITTPTGTGLPRTLRSLAGLTSAVALAFTITATDNTAPAGQPASVTMATDEVIITVELVPAFTNMAMFTTAIEAAENQTAAGAADLFVSTGSVAGTVNLMLGGTDGARFAVSPSGTLTFNDAPDFEMPRGMALSAANTNNYALTVTAMNSVGSAESGPITVTVTDENEAPVLDAITPVAFTEHIAGAFTITATDVDAGQMLTFTLTGEAHGATIAATGGFNWTPGEADGGVARMFTVTVTDDGTPPMSASTTFSITVEEDPAPTFGTATIDDQTYFANTAIETLTLPEATGGNGTITYALTPAPPAGLSFDPGTRDFTGTPTAAATAAMYTYTATDGDDNMSANDAVTLTFSITVSPMVTEPMVLGIDDLTDRTFNIYPNPVSGSLTVERKGIAGDEISIHDLTGRRIHVPVREQSPRKVVLDVSGLAGGMYLVKVSGSGSTVRRLIVEHRQERF